MFGGLDIGAVVAIVVAVIASMATGYAYFRSSAVKVWEQNAEAYRARVDLLEDTNADLLKKIEWLEQRVHELEARPEWSQVVALIGVSEKNIIKAVDDMRFEQQAQHLVALNEITAQVNERVRLHAREREQDA